MKYSEFLFKISEGQKKYCLELKFPEDDIRTDFHGMVYDLAHNYYCSHVAFELSEEAAKGNVMFGEGLYPYKTHIDRLTEVVKLKMLTTSYLSQLNKQYTIGVWTAFETSVSVIAESVLTETEKQELLSIKTDEIQKILKDKIDGATLEKVSSKLTEKHLSQVPLVRKFRKILTHYDGKYKRNATDDIQFIEFYGKIRNTLVHSNGIYYGKEYAYKFKSYIFQFLPGKIFSYSADKEMPPRLHIELSSTLSEIYIALTDLLSDIKEIKYPDTNAYWEE